MNINELGKKIRELRNQNGLSQEELAEKSQLSLRTIQRIESGETEPRGDTLIRLAITLNVDVEELTENTDEGNRSFLALLNLSALSFMLFPLAGIIFPMVLWILQRDKLDRVDETGKGILNFQITWSILRFMIIAIIFKTYSFQITPFSIVSTIDHFNTGLLVLSCAYAFNVVIIIYNMVRSLNDKPVIYQPAFKMIV